MLFRSPVTLPLHPSDWVRPAGNTDFRVTSPFGPRSDGFHGGLDIGNFRAGDDLVAVAAGECIAAGYLTHPWSTATLKFPTGNYGGLMVVLKHRNGMVSIYAHMANRSISVGEWAEFGQRLGSIGDTGSAQGAAHLHFGIQSPTPIQGVRSQPTSLGIGLDVDPWPLINGLIPDSAIPTEEEDDVLGSKTTFLKDPFRVKLGNSVAIRSDTRIADDTLIMRTSGYEATVIGYATGDVYDGSDVWWVYGSHNRGLVCFHSKTGTRLPEPVGYTADDLAAARAEGSRTGTAAGFADAKTKARVAVEGIKP